MLQHEIGNFVWASGSGRGEVCGSHKKFSGGERGSRKTNEATPGMWVGGARKGSLWLCYARLLTGKRKSDIQGNRQRPKPTPWEKNSWGS